MSPLGKRIPFRGHQKMTSIILGRGEVNEYESVTVHVIGIGKSETKGEKGLEIPRNDGRHF